MIPSDSIRLMRRQQGIDLQPDTGGEILKRDCCVGFATRTKACDLARPPNKRRGIFVALFRRLFIDHPVAVGESCVEHLITASGFGTKMVLAGAACVIHDFLPAIFRNRGRDATCVLHERMVVSRIRTPRNPVVS
jgi:hypothetical protein